jgi:hypothetical protein
MTDFRTQTAISGHHLKDKGIAVPADVRRSRGGDEKMNPPISDLTRPKTRDSKPQDLDSRYGSIGFPAVAAAARYPSDSRKPAPAQSKAPRREFEDEA